MGGGVYKIVHLQWVVGEVVDLIGPMLRRDVLPVLTDPRDGGYMPLRIDRRADEQIGHTDYAR